METETKETTEIGVMYSLDDNPRILWNPKTGDVTVETRGGAAHKNRDRFPMWLDLNHKFDNEPKEIQWAYPFIEFVTLVIRDNIPPQRVHAELCKIREYRDHISEDTPIVLPNC